MKRHPEQSSSLPACWQREAGSPCLRIECGNGDMHVFPYGQLVRAEMGREEESEQILIAYPTHEIRIAGRNLRELFLGLQDFAVKWVRPVPSRYAVMSDGETCVVETIKVDLTD